MATKKTVEPIMVQLKTNLDEKGSKTKKRKFQFDIALKLLTAKKKRWVLDDTDFQFDGLELSKKAKKAKKPATPDAGENPS